MLVRIEFRQQLYFSVINLQLETQQFQIPQQALQAQLNIKSPKIIWNRQKQKLRLTLTTTLLQPDISDYLKKKQEIRLPMNFSDFRQMVTTTKLFVDKTLFIAEIIETALRVILITRPRRWGKSSNLEMLYYFFKLEVDKYGRPHQHQLHRILFEGGQLKQNSESIVLKKLNIARHQKWDHF